MHYNDIILGLCMHERSTADWMAVSHGNVSSGPTETPVIKGVSKKHQGFHRDPEGTPTKGNPNLQKQPNNSYEDQL